MQRSYDLSLTTQGPTYPPSEVMDEAGNFIVIGRINRAASNGVVIADWGCALVSPHSTVPSFGANAPYKILRELDDPCADSQFAAKVLHTLPLPLPCNNYPMVFAPAQLPGANAIRRPSYPFHTTPIPDLRESDSRRRIKPVTLAEWCEARGRLTVTLAPDARSAEFAFDFGGLLPESLYTIMSLRARDLDPAGPTRPAPLGVPNVFVTDAAGRAGYRVDMPNPFPDPADPAGNRIINVVVLWMSYQTNHGGAIGLFGLGGDIHAQLKFRGLSFAEFVTLP